MRVFTAIAVLAAVAAAGLFVGAGLRASQQARSARQIEDVERGSAAWRELHTAMDSLGVLGAASLPPPTVDASDSIDETVERIERAGGSLDLRVRVRPPEGDGALAGWSGPSVLDSDATWVMTYTVTAADGRRLVMNVPLEVVRRRMAGASTLLIVGDDGQVLIDTRRAQAVGGQLPTPDVVVNATGLHVDGRRANVRGLGVHTPWTMAVLGDAGPAFTWPGAVTTGSVVLILGSVALGLTGIRTNELDRRRAARYDVLTGLLNRDAFEDMLRSEPGDGCAVVRLEVEQRGGLDGLGDARQLDGLLIATATRLARTVRPTDSVARVGDREFGVLARHVPDTAGAELVGQRLRGRLGPTMRVGDADVDVSARVGVAFHSSPGSDLVRAAANAGQALEQARTGIRPVVLHVPDQGSLPRTQLVSELRRALETGQVEVHLQPIIDTATGRVDHLEALARWTHPEHGLIPPDVFVPAAEAAGAVRDLTRYILERSMAHVVAWRAEGKDLAIAVNVSTVDLIAGFPDEIDRLLNAHGCPPSRLRLEVTETAVVHDLERVQAVLTELHERGVLIDVDDFGTGHASLAYVRGFPVSGVKIDRQFVSSMLSSRTDALIVRSSIELVHALGMQVTAEGVEDARTLSALRTWGCDHAQGYYIARPMPAAELDAKFAAGELRFSSLPG